MLRTSRLTSCFIIDGRTLKRLFCIDKTLSFYNYVISCGSISILLSSSQICSNNLHSEILLETYFISFWLAISFLRFLRQIKTLPSNSMILLEDTSSVYILSYYGVSIDLGTYNKSFLLILISLAFTGKLNEIKSYFSGDLSLIYDVL